MEGWDALKVTELRAELRQRRLQHVGVKKELVQRLAESDAEQSANPRPITSQEQRTSPVFATFDNVWQPRGTSNPEPVAASSPTIFRDAPADCDDPNHPPHDHKRDDIGEETRDDGTTEARRQFDAPQALHTHTFEHGVKPSSKHSLELPLHPPTPALYIRGFLRPLQAENVRTYLQALATDADSDVNQNTIELFHLDSIRTHVFVIFKETSMAIRTRSALHNVIWPEESTRQPLWVDFVPPENVRGWIAEEAAGGGNARRWEVKYGLKEDGTPTLAFGFTVPPPMGPTGFRPLPIQPAQREQGSLPGSPPPRSFAADSPINANDVPLGQRRNSVRPPPMSLQRKFADMPARMTRARPSIPYQPVSEYLAQERVSALRSHYSKDQNRNLGKLNEINRYTFESGGIVVDRGTEAFIGIRPPRREAAHRHYSGQALPSTQPPLVSSDWRALPSRPYSTKESRTAENTEFQPIVSERVSLRGKGFSTRY